MAHTTQVVESTQISDECIALKIRCCDDPLTDSVVTIMNVHTYTPAEIEAFVDKHHDHVKTRHSGLVAGLSHLNTLSNKIKKHE